MTRYDIVLTYDGRWAVIGVKGGRRESLGAFSREADAKEEIRFQESMDVDKARDRAGR